MRKNRVLGRGNLIIVTRNTGLGRIRNVMLERIRNVIIVTRRASMSRVRNGILGREEAALGEEQGF
jgi:hypothetical protein